MFRFFFIRIQDPYNYIVCVWAMWDWRFVCKIPFIYFLCKFFLVNLEMAFLSHWIYHQRQRNVMSEKNKFFFHLILIRESRKSFVRHFTTHLMILQFHTKVLHVHSFNWLLILFYMSHENKTHTFTCSFSLSLYRMA